MPKLILLRHIKSQWNEENRFTGWVDVPLNKNETYKVKELAEKIFQFQIGPVRSKPPQAAAAVPLAGRTSNGVK